MGLNGGIRGHDAPGRASYGHPLARLVQGRRAPEGAPPPLPRARSPAPPRPRASSRPGSFRPARAPPALSMDDPDCDSTWEEDAEGDGQGPSSAGSDDGEAGAPGGAEDEDQDADERAERPGAPQVQPRPRPGGLSRPRWVGGEALLRGEPSPGARAGAAPGHPARAGLPQCGCCPLLDPRPPGGTRDTLRSAPA